MTMTTPFINLNTPKEIHLQEGAHVIFLNNKIFNENICNGTVGVVTKLMDDENVEVTFPTFDNIVIRRKRVIFK